MIRPGQVSFTWAPTTLRERPQRVQDLLTAAGVAVEYRSIPTVGHAMHNENPQLYVDTVLEWVKTLDL